MKALVSFVYLYLLLFTGTISGQWSKQVDSLITTAEDLPNDTLKVARYGTLFEKLMFTDNSRALKYAGLELRLALQLDYKKGIGSGNLHFGTYHENTGRIDSAKAYYLLAKKEFTSMNSLRGELFLNHSLAGLEKKLGNYDTAIGYFEKNIAIYGLPDFDQSDLKGFNKIGAEYLGIAEVQKEKGNYKIAIREALKALRFFEDINHVRRTGNALKELGTIEQKRKHYQSALDYGLKAYKIYEDHDYNETRSHTAIDIGKSYLALGQFDNAELFFEEALAIGRQFDFIDAEADALTSLGILKRVTGNFPVARNHLENALKIHQDLGFKNDIARTLNEMALLEMETGGTQKAIELSTEAGTIAKELKSLADLSESYRIRSKGNEKLTEYATSLLEYKKYKALNDSIFDITQSQQIEELRTIYETGKKEQRIVLQENRIALLNQKQKNTALQRALLIAGLLGALAVFGLIYYGIRQKMKRNQLEKEKIDRELAFKKKELTTQALHIAKKNEVLENVKQKAKALKTSEKGVRGYQQLIQTINFDQQDDKNWENFTQYFEQVHKDFSKTVKTKYPEITKNELRLMALLKMNLSSKEIATILNISSDGIKKARQRLRKKMELSREESLEASVLSL